MGSGSRPSSPAGSRAIVVDVASKSARSAEPGTKSMPRVASTCATEAWRSRANSSRIAVHFAARSPRPSAAASRTASFKPASAQKSSQYEWTGFAE
jgi:hypothetical protein